MLNKDVKCFAQWKMLGNKSNHLDNFVEVEFNNVTRRIEGSREYEEIQTEWNSELIMETIKEHFRGIPAYCIDLKEAYLADEAWKTFVKDYYESKDLEVPLEGPQGKEVQQIEKEFCSSVIRQPLWETLYVMNRDNYTTCKILKQPLPGDSDTDLDIGIIHRPAFKEGNSHLSKTAFITDLNEYTRTLILRGKMEKIDYFMEIYKKSKK